MGTPDKRVARWRRGWDKQALTYDRGMNRFDRWLLRDTRAWICSRASGEVLEVAVGTGLNLPHYPAGIRLTGIDISAPMLDRARQRADELGRQADLRLGDALSLPFESGSFDTVVCTFGLCAIPDDRAALAQMLAVLRPGGLLLLADHVASTNPLIRAAQWIAELVSVPLSGEHYLRRPYLDVRAAGLTIEEHQRFARGTIERLAARKPSTTHSPVGV